MIRPSFIVTGATRKTGNFVTDEFRRYAAQPRNQRNWLRQLAASLLAPLSPGFNFDGYDRELGLPFPSKPKLAPESEVWRYQHNFANAAKPASPRPASQARLRATGRAVDF